MSGLMGGKVDSRAADRAEADAKEAERKAAEAEAQSLSDAEYRRKNQRGKSSTILNSVDDASTGSRSLLGG
jgi:hypothetical protein